MTRQGWAFGAILKYGVWLEPPTQPRLRPVWQYGYGQLACRVWGMVVWVLAAVRVWLYVPYFSMAQIPILTQNDVRPSAKAHNNVVGSL